MKKNNILNANVKVNQIEDLLNKALDIYNELPTEIQNALLSYHNENSTIAHCLRWGLQAAEDLRNDWHTVVSEIEVDN